LAAFLRSDANLGVPGDAPAKIRLVVDELDSLRSELAIGAQRWGAAHPQRLALEARIRVLTATYERLRRELADELDAGEFPADAAEQRQLVAATDEILELLAAIERADNDERAIRDQLRVTDPCRRSQSSR
jgi:hypothetical protein